MASMSIEKQKNLDRFEELINVGSELVEQMEPLAKRWSLPKRLAPVCVSEFIAFTVNSRNFMRIVLVQAQEFEVYLQLIGEMKPCIESTQNILGYLVGLQSDYEKGTLDKLRDPAAAAISVEYLSQAEELLETHGTLKGDYGPHIPAAAVCGAVLEHSLRRICVRHTIELTYESKGKEKRKMLDRLIADLQKEKVITVSKADWLRSWAKLRNSVDHGNFREAPPNDVKSMIIGVKSFLEEMQ